MTKIKKLLFSSALILFLGILPDTLFASVCTLSGVLKLDHNWVQVMNTEINNKSGAYLQDEWIQLRTNGNDPYEVIDVYTREFSSEQLTFPADSIVIPSTPVDCNKKYVVYFAYQIYKLGPGGGLSHVGFIAADGNAQINVTYPMDFDS